MERKWWKEGVVYQIYPRSFKDTTGNGLGDLEGVIQKLDYLQSLGVNMIWLCPIYESPNDDNGYDISDYRKIADEFGGNTIFERLLEAMHERGLKLIMDLVVNHSSDEHHWFKEAKKNRNNPYHDYYIWRGNDQNQFPNNWQSVFNGSVWNWNEATQEYYLHLYTKKQPDLNWENPKVRQEIYDIVNFWLTKGVDGLRMDVISLISKRLSFTDVPNEMPFIDVMEKVYANGPRVHEFLKEMNQKVLSNYDIVTIGEGPGVNLEHGPRYVSEEEKDFFNMVFHFDHLTIDYGPEGKYDPVPYDFIRFKSIFSQWNTALANDGWNSIFLGNHDFSRIVSRFGNDGIFRNESAKLLATMLMTLRGTPYVYQGDEIGMVNVAHNSITSYDDVETQNAWKAALEAGKDMNKFMKAVHWQSRDNARTPMQWNDLENAGFSSVKPWVDVHENYKTINVASAEEDPNSILHYYRNVIAFRKDNPTLIYGDFKDIYPNHPKFFGYIRSDSNTAFLIIHNFSDHKLNWDNPHKTCVLEYGNYINPDENELAPWESRVYRIR